MTCFIALGFITATGCIPYSPVAAWRDESGFDSSCSRNFQSFNGNLDSMRRQISRGLKVGGWVLVEFHVARQCETSTATEKNQAKCPVFKNIMVPNVSNLFDCVQITDTHMLHVCWKLPVWKMKMMIPFWDMWIQPTIYSLCPNICVYVMVACTWLFLHVRFVIDPYDQPIKLCIGPIFWA